MSSPEKFKRLRFGKVILKFALLTDWNLAGAGAAGTMVIADAFMRMGAERDRGPTALEIV
jgi:hypothetical protein